MFRRLWCKHENEALSSRQLGVCVTWAGTFAVEYEWTRVCKSCGRKKMKRGYVPSDPTTVKDEKGWPLNPDGLRMAVTSDNG